MNNIDIRPYLRLFYKGNWGYFSLAMLRIIVFTAGNLMLAWILQQTLDLASGIDTGRTLAQLTLLTGICLLIFMFSFLLEYFSKPRFIAKASAQYRQYAFETLSQKNISAFYGENSSKYLSALNNDMNIIETDYLSNLFLIAEQMFLFVATLAMMFWYSMPLTIVSIGFSLIPLISSMLAGNHLGAAERAVSDQNESYLASLKDSLSGFSVIKSFRAESQMCAQFYKQVKSLATAKERSQKIRILISMIATIGNVLVQMGVFIVGTYLALSGKGVTAGTVLVFVQLLNYILQPISTVPAALVQQKAAKELIRKLASSLNENVRDDGCVRKLKLDSDISMTDVSFSYEEGKTVLQHINIKFEAGKSYALVGASGCGKSTILNLLLGAYSDYHGKICFDNTELKDLHADDLYDIVSLIQQNVFVFNASIRENITMFSDFPKEDVDRVIDKAGLRDIIERKGEGYLCGENGSGLSGGEKQRISIARSLLRNSQVLLVDEATAALDAATASQVANAILDLNRATRIVVTHNLDAALLKRYDCIYTLKNGSVAEQGSFDELMEKKEYFYSLYTVSQ